MRLDSLITLVFLGLVAVTFYKLVGFIHDDAFITLKYARNLGEHGQLAWNLGEPGIEGYTSPLHVVLNAGLIRIGIDPMTGARLIGFIGFGLMLVAGALALRGLNAPAIGRVAILAGLAAPATIAWVWGGLEAPLVGGLIALGMVGGILSARGNGSIRHAVLGSIAFGIAYLARPEAAVANFAMGLGILLFAELPIRDRLLRFVAFGTISFAVLCGHLLFRYQAYGDVVPLTFHAKVGLETSVRLQNGVSYVLNSSAVAPVIMCATMACVLMIILRKRLGPLSRIMGITLLVQAMLLIWLGGDHMPWGRMMLPLLPAASFLFLAILADVNARWQQVMAYGIAGISALALLSAPYGRPDAAARVGSLVGAYLEQNLPEPSTIAVATAGSTPFFAPRHMFIDTLGLNDPHIAKRENVPIRTRWQTEPGHGKGDGQYVMSRSPDIIIIGPAEGTTSDQATHWFLTGLELSEMPQFQQCYEEVRASVKPSELTVWSARTFSKPLELVYYQRTCD